VFERFTERSRQAIVFAQDEARAFKHDYIGTEHILLGLMRTEEGVAAQALAKLGVTLEDARARVVRIVGCGEQARSGQVPFTPRAKKVLEQALREALSLGHNYIGTEHVLLGLLRDSEGVAARVLVECGPDAERIRRAVIEQGPGPDAPLREAPAPLAGTALPSAVNVGLGPDVRRLLRLAAAQALNDDRPAIDAGDVLTAFNRADSTVSLIRELGIGGDALQRAVEGWRRGDGQG
jgi:ATP-dependent Clp protease ATP-binding subunit ClpC